MAENGAAFAKQSDIDRLIEELHNIENNMGNQYSKNNSKGSVPKDPKPNDLQKMAGNLGLAVPTGFLLLHNDFERLFNLSSMSSTSSNESSKTTAGGILDKILKGVGVSTSVAFAMENLAISFTLAKNTLTATLPEDFNILLAEMALTKYFTKAGYLVDFDTKGNVTKITRDESLDGTLLKDASFLLDEAKDATAFFSSLKNPIAKYINGIGSALTNATEDLSAAFTLAKTQVTTELPESFNILLTEVSLTKYFKEAGYTVDFNSDGSIKEIKLKENTTLDTVMSTVDEVIDTGVKLAGKIIAWPALALEGIADSIGKAGKNLTLDIKLASEVASAELPEQFTTLLAEVQLAKYFEESGYQVTLDENGKITSIKVKELNVVQKGLKALGDAASSLVGGLVDVAFTPVKSIVNIVTDAKQDIDLGKMLNEASMDIYTKSLNDITELDPSQSKLYKTSFANSMSNFFNGLNSLFSSNTGDLPGAFSGNLIKNLNKTYLSAVENSLGTASMNSDNIYNIQSTFNDSAIRNKIGTLIQEVSIFEESVNKKMDTLIENSMTIVTSDDSNNVPVSNVDYDEMPG